jgi:hypothetical protein
LLLVVVVMVVVVVVVVVVVLMLLVENVVSKMSVANGWTSEVPFPTTVEIFYVPCRDKSQVSCTASIPVCKH